MAQRGITPALEQELNRKIQELDREHEYTKLLFNEIAPSARSSSVSESDQVGVTIPRLMGSTESFITNPSNVGLGIISRMIETDPTILSAVQFKTLMMLSKIGEFHHDDQDVTDFVRGFISKMYGPTFKESLESQASKFGFGFSISEIIWGLNKTNQKVPVKVKTYHPTTICFEVDGFGEITDQGIVQFVVQNMQYSNPNTYYPTSQYGFDVRNPFTTPNDRLLPYRMPFLSNYGLTRIPKTKVIHHVNSVGLAFGSPYGKTSVRTAHLAWQMKVYFQKQMGVAGKRQSTPFIWGTAPFNQNKVRVEKPNDEGGFSKYRQLPSDQPSPFAQDMNPVEALSAILANRQEDDSIVTGPESMGYKIQAISANMDLNQYLAVLNWLDVQIFRAFLLPSLVMTDGSAGSRSLGDKHFQVVDRIAEEEAQVFSQSVVDQLIRPAIAMNFGEQDNYGHFAQRPQNIEERERLSNIFVSLASAGFMKAYDPVDGAYVRSTLHLPEQEDSFYQESMPNYPPIDGEGPDLTADSQDLPEEHSSLHPDGTPKTQDEAQLETKSSAAFNGAQVTAVVNVVTSVSKGEIPLQTGIEILKSMFGFSQEQASRLLPADLIQQVGAKEEEAIDAEQDDLPDDSESALSKSQLAQELMGIRRTKNYQGYLITVSELVGSFSWMIDRNGMSCHRSREKFNSVDSATESAERTIDQITKLSPQP